MIFLVSDTGGLGKKNPSTPNQESNLRSSAPRCSIAPFEPLSTYLVICLETHPLRYRRLVGDKPLNQEVIASTPIAEYSKFFLRAA